MENLFIAVLGGVVLMTIVRVLFPRRVPPPIIVITAEQEARSRMSCLPLLIGVLILLVILVVSRV